VRRNEGPRDRYPAVTLWWSDPDRVYDVTGKSTDTLDRMEKEGLHIGRDPRRGKWLDVEDWRAFLRARDSASTTTNRRPPKRHKEDSSAH
jgi:hypothetical protein